MRISEILLEDISAGEARRNIIDILSTEIPGLVQRLISVADKFANSYTPKRDDGVYKYSDKDYEKSLNFVLGGQTSVWYKDRFWASGRTSLYSFARSLPGPLRADLSDYLTRADHSSFRSIEVVLLPILTSIASATRDRDLKAAIGAAKLAYDRLVDAKERSTKRAREMNAGDDDDLPTARTASEPTGMGDQYAAVEGVINDVLGRINKKDAGEIRNAISRADNKLLALQQELTRRGIKP